MIEDKRQLNAAHRGYRKLFPENTMTAFQQAVVAGSTVIETDVHVSKDGVIVLCHDVATGRTFDKDYVIKEVPYSTTLEDLKNKQDPSEHLPTLQEALEWLDSLDGVVKLMLDIKGDNDESIAKLVVKQCLGVNSDITFWYDRIIFGLWDPKYYHKDVLDGFEVINITLGPHFARKFLRAVYSSGGSIEALSVMHLAMYNPVLRSQVLSLVQEYGVKLYFWTVNDPRDMYILTSTLDKKIVKGFVTDDPKAVTKFVNGEREPVPWSRNLRNFLLSNVLWGVTFLFRCGINVRPAIAALQKRGLI